jgi:cytochrome P450
LPGLLDLLLAARFANGSSMSDMEVRDPLVTLAAGGHETMAVGRIGALSTCVAADRSCGALS